MGSRVGIVIPTPNLTSPRFLRCISNLETIGHKENWKIIPIESSGPEFRFSRSVNRGIREADECDFILLLNDDCLPEQGCIESMVAYTRRNPSVGIVGAVIRSPDGVIDHVGGFLSINWTSTMRTILSRGLYGWAARIPIISPIRLLTEGHLMGVEGFHRLSEDDAEPIDFVTGACMLITRGTIDAIGTFDEEFEFRCEDTDYCLRALQEGIGVDVDIKANAIHEISASGFDNGKVRRSGRRLRQKYGRDDIVRIRKIASEISL